MNRIIETATRTAAAAVIAAGLLASATAAHAADTSVLIVNMSMETIYSIHISEVTDKYWRDDLLGQYVLLDGYQYAVQPAGHGCFYDVLLTYESGYEEVFWNVNLCTAVEIVADEWETVIYHV